MFHSLAMSAVAVEPWKPAQDNAKQLVDKAGQFQRDADQIRGDFQATNEGGKRLVSDFESRTQWMELFKAINASLPTGEDKSTEPPAKLTSDKKIMLRRDLHVTGVTCQQVENVGQWYATNKSLIETTSRAPGAPANASGSEAPTAEPQGPGYIVTVSGYHYHNNHAMNRDMEYVRGTLQRLLRDGQIELPAADGSGKLEPVKFKDLGILFPVVTSKGSAKPVPVDDPYANLAAGGGPATAPAVTVAPPGAADPGKILVPCYDFTLEFCWQPKTPAARLEAKKALKDKQNAPAP
jgi:type IV pilus assembly protein PilM